MSGISFVPDSLLSTDITFPTLKITKDQKKARVVALSEPQRIWRHTLRQPEIDEQGNAIMVWVDSKKTGGQVQVHKKKYVGSFKCLGDYEYMEGEGKGLDPDNCPMCEEAVNGSFDFKPERRFGIHVARYQTKAGSTDLTSENNLMIEIQLWRFNENTFRKLVEYCKKGTVNISSFDIYLTLDSDEDYQKYGLEKSDESHWTSQESFKGILKDLYGANHLEPDEIKDMLARTKEAKWLVKYEINDIKRAWDIINGKVSVSEVDDPWKGKSSGEQLNNILNTNRKPDPTPTFSAPESADDDDSEDVAEPEPVVTPPAKKATRAAKRVPPATAEVLNVEEESAGDEKEPVPANAPRTTDFTALLDKL